MTYLATLWSIARSESDPKVLKSSGPGSPTGPIGWLAPSVGSALAWAVLTTALGVKGKEPLVRAYGLREIGSGDTVKQRPRGGLDIATLAASAPRSSRQAALALLATPRGDRVLRQMQELGSVATTSAISSDVSAAFSNSKFLTSGSRR